MWSWRRLLHMVYDRWEICSRIGGWREAVAVPRSEWPTPHVCCHRVHDQSLSPYHVICINMSRKVSSFTHLLSWCWQRQHQFCLLRNFRVPWHRYPCEILSQLWPFLMGTAECMLYMWTDDDLAQRWSEPRSYAAKCRCRRRDDNFSLLGLSPARRSAGNLTP